MTTANAARDLSRAAQRRMLAKPGEPLFLATWDQAVFVHYEADPVLLQRQVPFQLDLRDGCAFVSIVAFTLLRMRPRLGGRLGEWLFRPIASDEFLNVRTYVRHAGEPGIFFLAEWLSNPLSVRVGPRSFGLPYRFGHLRYEHAPDSGEILGTVAAREGRLEYRATISAASFDASGAESRTEFLLERYTAFTCQRGRRRLFRVWHEPWEQAPIENRSHLRQSAWLDGRLVEKRRMRRRKLFPRRRGLDGPPSSYPRVTSGSSLFVIPSAVEESLTIRISSLTLAKLEIPRLRSG